MKLHKSKLGYYGMHSSFYMIRAGAVEYSNTGRESRCKRCGKLIPKTVNKFRYCDFSVSWKHYHEVGCVRSICHECIPQEIDGINKTIKALHKMKRKVLNRIKKENIKEIEEKYKERELLERI